MLIKFWQVHRQTILKFCMIGQEVLIAELTPSTLFCFELYELEA